MREVVITGAGLITPVGHSLDELKDTLLHARSGVRLVRDGPQPRVAATVQGEYEVPIAQARQQLTDRVAEFALVATGRALKDAALDMSSVDATRVGVMLGNSLGATETAFTVYKELCESRRPAVNLLLRNLSSSATSHVAIQFGIKGRCTTVTAECASSSTAVGDAVRMIRHGYLDTILAGGTEAPLGEGTFSAWERLRMLARPNVQNPGQSCRPFSKSRTGLVVGEGAVVLVLEAEEHAKARGARILARVLGYGESSDAANVLLPDKDGQCVAVRRAIQEAGISPSEIGYVNAHGTATELGDIVENAMLRDVFGSAADSIPVSSTKALHGHLLGAAGALELCVAMIALRDGLLAPTANLDQPDPKCDLDYIPNQARQVKPPKTVMSSNFGFGGANACLILGAHPRSG